MLDNDLHSMLSNESSLSKEFLNVIKRDVDVCEKLAPADESNTIYDYFLNVVVLTVAHSCIFHTLNKKTTLRVWNLHKKVWSSC